MKKRLLVTGAGGFLGGNLCRLALREWEVFGTVFSRPAEIPGVKILRADLTDSRQREEMFRKIRPQAVIHAAAAAAPNFCQLHPEESEKINVDAAVALAGLCAARDLSFVFTSTDLVFDGLHPPYAEDDPVAPVSVYGEQKARAELGVLAAGPKTCVCRLSLVFGRSLTASPGFLRPVLEALRQGREQRLFTDEFRTMVSVTGAAAGLLLMTAKGRSGIFHLGGPERISRYRFGLLLAETFGLAPALVVPCRRRDVPMPAPRPADVSLDSRRAQTLGFRPLPLREELDIMRTEWE